MKPSQIRNLAISRAAPPVLLVHNDGMEHVRHCKIGRVKEKRSAVLEEIARIRRATNVRRIMMHSHS